MKSATIKLRIIYEVSVYMNKKGLIGVQMSTIAPAKMPSFDAYAGMAIRPHLGYHCAEISQVPMTKENVL